MDYDRKIVNKVSGRTRILPKNSSHESLYKDEVFINVNDRLVGLSQLTYKELNDILGSLLRDR